MRILETLALNLFNSQAFSAQELSENKLAVFFYNVAHYLYYVNFASDFLVYAFSRFVFFGVKFRLDFLDVRKLVFIVDCHKGKPGLHFLNYFKVQIKPLEIPIFQCNS